MLLLDEIKAVDIENYIFYTVNGRNDIGMHEAKLVNIDGDTKLIFEVLTENPENTKRKSCSMFTYDFSIDDRLKEALKVVNISIEEVVDYAKEKVRIAKERHNMILKLREDTGRSLIRCKRALKETDYTTFAAAKQWLKDHPERIGI